jgi:hypothetical protein
MRAKWKENPYEHEEDVSHDNIEEYQDQVQVDGEHSDFRREFHLIPEL